MESINDESEVAKFEKQIGALLEINRYEDALKVISRVIASDPEEPWYHYQRARAYSGLEEYKLARDACFVAIKCNPEYSWAFYLLSTINNVLHDFDAELSNAEEAVRIDPEEPAFLARLAHAQMQSGLVKKAFVTAQSAVKIDPESEETHELLGDVALEFGKFKVAEEHYRVALSLNADDPGLINDLSRTLIAQKKWREAIDTLEQAIRLDPANKVLQKNLFKCINFWLYTKITPSKKKAALEELPLSTQQFYAHMNSRLPFFLNLGGFGMIIFWVIALVLFCLPFIYLT